MFVHSLVLEPLAVHTADRVLICGTVTIEERRIWMPPKHNYDESLSVFAQRCARIVRV